MDSLTIEVRDDLKDPIFASRECGPFFMSHEKSSLHIKKDHPVLVKILLEVELASQLPKC